jgi:hypothetical protein
MPIFGYNTIGGSSHTSALNQASVGIYALSQNGSVSKLTAYLSGATHNVKGLIYSDSSGTPNALLGTSNPTSVNSLGAWFDLTFSSSVALTTGNYWLGVIGDGSDVWVFDSGSSNLNYDAANSYAAPSNPFVSGSTAGSLNMSVYATYTVGSSGSLFVAQGDLNAMGVGGPFFKNPIGRHQQPSPHHWNLHNDIHRKAA